MVLKLSGPETLLENLDTVKMCDSSLPVVERDGSYYLAREDDEERVATIIATPIKPLAAEALGSLGSSSPDYDNRPDDVP